VELTGTVRSIQSFGVFVDIGGLDGLIPLSEMGWDRNKSPEEILSIGEKITVKVIGIEWERNRLTLSLKAMREDPWVGIENRYTVGEKIKGTVVRLTSFGAFISLEPGVEGLIHVSNISTMRRIKHPKEVLEVGQWIEPYVLSVDSQHKKISLSLESPFKEEPQLPEVGEFVYGTVEQVMPYGVFIRLENGITGLLPNSETNTPKGTHLKKVFPEGTRLQVGVIAVDKEHKKITLSRIAVAEQELKDAVNHYKSAKDKGEEVERLGNFGELLKKHLEGEKKE